MLRAMAQESHIKAATAAGADTFFIRPFRPSAVMERLHPLLPLD